MLLITELISITNAPQIKFPLLKLKFAGIEDCLQGNNKVLNNRKEFKIYFIFAFNHLKLMDTFV